MGSNDLRIGRKSQKTLLGHPAKEDQIVRETVEPAFCRRMVDVRIERHREPYINVGKERHLLHQRSPRCARCSSASCQVRLSERAAAELGSSLLPAANQAP